MLETSSSSIVANPVVAGLGKIVLVLVGAAAIAVRGLSALRSLAGGLAGRALSMASFGRLGGAAMAAPVGFADNAAEGRAAAIANHRRVRPDDGRRTSGMTAARAGLAGGVTGPRGAAIARTSGGVPSRWAPGTLYPAADAARDP